MLWSFSPIGRLLSKLTFAPKRRVYVMIIFLFWTVQLGTCQPKVSLSLFCAEHYLSTNGQFNWFPLIFGIPKTNKVWFQRVQLKPMGLCRTTEVLSIFASSLERSDITSPCELPDGSFLVTWCWMFGQGKAFWIWPDVFVHGFVCVGLRFQVFHIQNFMLCIYVLFSYLPSRCFSCASLGFGNLIVTSKWNTLE